MLPSAFDRFGDASAGHFPYGLILYDIVADGEVNSGYAQMPSPAWLALAALAIAGLAARRLR